ncbi:helix-turn-helix transcriptional regulator [Patulibacter sp. NPDC049589]|uniref:helix-turn-helix transcriptional regulator n=1 Tax=Patulibacter sp. NPDC049589 TaxID=3154731 RepID=UPI003412FCBF
MHELRDRDVRALLDLVGEANGADDLDEFRAAVIPGVRRMVPAEIVSYNEVAGDGDVLAAISDPVLPAALHGAWAAHAHEHPLLRRLLRTHDARPYRFSDVVTHEELAALGLYRDLYEPLGIAHQVAFALPSGPTLSVAVALMRGGPDDFTARDVRMLDLARPHLAQAYRNAALRERMAGTIDALLQGFDDDGEAVAVVDDAGRVAAVSGPAARLLGELDREARGPGSPAVPGLRGHAGDGATVRPGDPLPASLRAWWLAPSDTTVPAPFAAEPGRDGRLVARRLKRSSRTDLDLLVIERLARGVPLDVLRSLGLTARETAVLDAFIRGGSTASVAAALGVAPRTVDKHAQSVHAKLGVRSRTEAIAAAWTAAGLTEDERLRRSA